MKILFKRDDNSDQKSIDVVADSKIGDSREAVQMLLGLPENVRYHLTLVRTSKKLEDNLSFTEAGIRENDQITLSSPQTILSPPKIALSSPPKEKNQPHKKASSTKKRIDFTDLSFDPQKKTLENMD